MFLIQFFIVASDVGKEDLTVDRIPMQFFYQGVGPPNWNSTVSLTPNNHRSWPFYHVISSYLSVHHAQLAVIEHRLNFTNPPIFWAGYYKGTKHSAHYSNPPLLCGDVGSEIRSSIFSPWITFETLHAAFISGYALIMTRSFTLLL
jgi:hypothetical protein